MVTPSDRNRPANIPPPVVVAVVSSVGFVTTTSPVFKVVDVTCVCVADANPTVTLTGLTLPLVNMYTIFRVPSVAIARFGTNITLLAEFVMISAVAVIPGAAGIRGADYTDPVAFNAGFRTAIVIAASLLVSAAVLAAKDPDAVIAVFTADHLIEPAEEFRGIVAQGFKLVERFPETRRRVYLAGPPPPE